MVRPSWPSPTAREERDITDLPTWLTASGLIGAALFGLLSAFFPPLNAEIYALGVAPHAQGRGLGGRLTAVALAIPGT